MRPFRTPRARELVGCKFLRFNYQSHAGFHQPLRQNQALEFQSWLHLERKILLDVGEPRGAEGTSWSAQTLRTNQIQ
jgi:hypothetical protein